MWTNTKSFSVVFGTDAVDGSVVSVGNDDGFTSPVVGATVVSVGTDDGVAADGVTGAVGADEGVDSSANAGPPEVAIANPTIVADASV